VPAYVLNAFSAIATRAVLSDNCGPYHYIQCQSVAVADSAKSTPEVILADDQLHALHVAGTIQLSASRHVFIVHWQLYRRPCQEASDYSPLGLSAIQLAQ